MPSPLFIQCATDTHFPSQFVEAPCVPPIQPPQAQSSCSFLVFFAITPFLSVSAAASMVSHHSRPSEQTRRHASLKTTRLRGSWLAPPLSHGRERAYISSAGGREEKGGITDRKGSLRDVTYDVGVANLQATSAHKSETTS
jgi:hypothetical protein